MKQDRNFDDLSERFARNIYGSTKGQIRHAVLWQHLSQQLPHLLIPGSLNVLDAGCGMGQLSSKLIAQGHRLTLCDISKEMLNMAQRLIEQEVIDKHQTITYKHASIQDLAKGRTEQFSIALCHAVLEWLVDAESVINALADLVIPGGQLSLTFYNRDALIYRNLIRGNLRKVKSGDYAGHPGGLTPSNPLHPETVFTWLERAGFEIKFKAGVRVFYDYIPRAVREKIALEDILDLEQQYSQTMPYSMLARYIHVIAERRHDE